MLFSRRVPPPDDGLPRSPAAARNREPIAEVLARHLPKRGSVLEIASGTGEHAVFFATRFPGLVWQPSDADAGAVSASAAWRAASGQGGAGPLPNLLPPMQLDVERSGWTEEVGIRFPVAIIAINMIHISPWSATVGLLAGASKLLMPGRALVFYGPFRRQGRRTARSNASFDASLRRQDAEWGVRDLETVVEAATQAGFGLGDLVEMPANNLTLVFRRR